MDDESGCRVIAGADAGHRADGGDALLRRLRLQPLGGVIAVVKDLGDIVEEERKTVPMPEERQYELGPRIARPVGPAPSFLGARWVILVLVITV